MDATTCTLVFQAPSPNAPACIAVNETNGGGFSVPVGVRTTVTPLQFYSAQPVIDGDVIAYHCIGY